MYILAHLNIGFFELVIKPGILNDSLDFKIESYMNKVDDDYECYIDWGDGTISTVNKNNVNAVNGLETFSHTYSEAGIYTIKIKGNCYSVRFGSTGASYSQAVYDCNFNWKALGNITSCYCMFSYCYNAIFNVSKLPSNAINCEQMFYECHNISIAEDFKIPDSVTSCKEMFYRTKFVNLPSNFTLPKNIQTCRQMFFDCEFLTLDLNQLANNAPVEGWSSLSNIMYMFTNCRNVTGSRSAFLAKCPNANYSYAFNGTSTIE